MDGIWAKASADGSWWWRSHISKGTYYHGFGNSWITPHNEDTSASAFELRLGTSTGIVYGSHFFDVHDQKYAAYLKLCTDGVSAGLKAEVLDGKGSFRAMLSPPNIRDTRVIDLTNMLKISMTYRVNES